MIDKAAGTSADGASSGPSVLYGGLAPGVGPESLDGSGDAMIDLHLDGLVAAMTAGDGRSDLTAAFLTPLSDPADVHFRHDIFRDLESEQLADSVRRFTEDLRAVEDEIERAATLRYRRHRDRVTLESVDAYLSAVDALGLALDEEPLESAGLSAFRDFVRSYRESPAFQALERDARRLLARLSSLTYQLRIGEHRITVGAFDDGPDLAAEIAATFERFRGDVDPSPAPPDVYVTTDLNQIDVAILERVARLNPGAFRDLDAFARANIRFVHPVISRFERDVTFYLAYMDVMSPLRAAGMPFCYPSLSSSKDLRVSGIYDVALAHGRPGPGPGVSTTDVELTANETMLVITGPNQSGKTTFARAIGQLHHLASIGCPVPAREATVPLVDAVYTHFDRAEDPSELSGRLEADLRRMAVTIDRLTPRSLVILNESLSSTTVQDALILVRGILGRIAAAGARSVTVTFLHELATEDDHTVSMVAALDPTDPLHPNIQIVRRPADGRAAAIAIADRHRLGYDAIRERLGR